MQDTNYSVGPKFFGTSTKSTTLTIQSLGSMRAIDVHQAQELTTPRVWTKPLRPIGLSARTPSVMPSSISSTGSTPLQIDTR